MPRVATRSRPGSHCPCGVQPRPGHGGGRPAAGRGAAPLPPPVQDEAAGAAPAEDTYGDLMKQLLDAGALTQEEFDAQKQKILSA